MAKMIKKFNNDLKLPTKGAVQKAATPATKAATAAKPTTAKKITAKPAKKADLPALVNLLLPEGSIQKPHNGAPGVTWSVTPQLPGHKYPHWFRDDKFPTKKTPKGIVVTVPRAVAASKGMMDYVQS